MTGVGTALTIEQAVPHWGNQVEAPPLLQERWLAFSVALAQYQKHHLQIDTFACEQFHYRLSTDLFTTDGPTRQREINAIRHQINQQAQENHLKLELAHSNLTTVSHFDSSASSSYSGETNR